MTTPLTVLFHSNAPWCGTGYGTQTKQAVERFKRDGHAIAVNANYGLQGMKTLWDGVPVFPMGVESYSNDTVRANFASWRAENPDNPAHVIVLFDAWTMPREMYDGVPVSIWTMVDHQPIPPKVLNVLQWPNVTPIAVTKFGLEQMQRAGLTNARYIPMAIDTNLYQPTETFDGKTGREIMGMPDDDLFIVSAINANKAGGAGGIHRKAWAENLLAFSIFAQDKPDARLYLHTERFGNHGGLALDVLLKVVGLKPEQYRFVNQHAMHNGIPNEAMAAIYTATDVLLAATLGEGFGLTLLEAQSCGTVAIANNFTAQPELLGDGWLTEGQPYWDGAQLAWFNTPNIPSIVDALEQAYARGRGRSDKAREHAAQYDADLVWDRYWKPYLAELAEPEPEPVAVESFTIGRASKNPPRLTIYIPTIRPDELSNLLASLAPQLTPECEVIVSDDNPTGRAGSLVRELLAGAKCRVTYEHNVPGIGGPRNLHKGLQAGSGEWLWMISDDDTVTELGVHSVLKAIDGTEADRLILMTDTAVSAASGNVGTAEDINEQDPGLLIAATLITANVLRREALDVETAARKIDTLYGPAWAYTGCRLIEVLDDEVFRVGVDHVGEFVAASNPNLDIAAVWAELLKDGYGVQVTPASFSWNFTNVHNGAA